MSMFEFEEGENNKFVLKRHENKKRSSYEKSKISSLKCLFFDQMSSFWEFHRIFGVLPFSRDLEKESITLKWLSTPVFYSAIFCTFVDFGAYLSISRRIANAESQPKSSFQAGTYSLLNVILLLPVFFIPLTCWTNTGKFIEYLNEWIALEINYRKISNSQLNLQLKKCSNAVIVFLILYGVFTTSIFATFDVNVSFLEPVAYVQFLTSVMALPIYFAMVTRLVKIITRDVLIHLSKDLKNKSASCKLYQHRIFWLQLRKITINVWRFQFRRIAVFGSCGIFAMSLAIYNALENLFLSDDPNIGIRSIVMLITSSLMLLLAYVTARRAQLLKTYVEKDFIHQFFKHRKSLNFYDEDTVAEIKLFSKMFKISNVKISGNGYFEISQSSLISLLSLVTTNLLILLQFEIYLKTVDNNQPD